MITRSCTKAAASAALLCGMAGYAEPAASHPDNNVGNVNFPVSCNAATQQAFNRATAMLYHFWFPQALNAYADIARADPECAMAYWGMAMSARTNPLVGAPPPAAVKAGAQHIEKAKTLGAKSQRERDYIAAMDIYYRDWDTRDLQARVLDYEKAMESLYRRYPDDLGAATFYALALNEAIIVLPADKDFKRQLKAASVTESVLARQPDHPGALHYLIHSYDFPALASRGVPAANKYASVAPSAPHALHMPSHIYSMLGMWPQSVQSNEAAVSVAKGYVHAMDFMVYAHLQMAQDDQAQALLERSVAIQKSGTAAMERSPTGATLTVHTAHAAIPARYAIERGAWAEAAALPVQNTVAIADAITHFTRAMGHARLNAPATARTEIARLEELEGELAAAKQPYWAEQVSIQRRAASAWAAYAEGSKDEAVKLMRTAADMEDASEKHVAMENRLWPMRELLAEMLIDMGQPAAALTEFEASLQEARNRLRGLYGAALAAERSGDKQKAAGYYGQLIKLTVNGNKQRPEIARAQAFLAAR